MSTTLKDTQQQEKEKDMGEIKNRLLVGLSLLAVLALATVSGAAAAEGKVNINAAGIEVKQ